MAADLLVWSVNKREVRVRQAVINPDAWQLPRRSRRPVSPTPGCGRRSARSSRAAGSASAASSSFPDDPEQVRRIEEAFGLKTREAGG